MSHLKLILFDIDGTLLNAKGLGRAAKQRAMQEIFGETGNVAHHPFGGKTDWQLALELLAESGYTREQVGEAMSDYQQAMARHTQALASKFAVEPCPGALDLIHTLRQRDDVVLGLVTGNVEATAPIKLRAAGYDPVWFVVGAYGSESANRRDLPKRALDRALVQTGQTIAPESVIIVGDTPEDVACARALGAVAVTVDTGFATDDELAQSQPDYRLKNLTEFMGKIPL